MEKADFTTKVDAIKRAIKTAQVSVITHVPTNGMLSGATDPPSDANAPNDVASNAIPASPTMSKRLARTLAIAKK